MSKKKSKIATPINIAAIKKQSTEQDIEICLVMIVKDEASDIEKCLSAVAPYIKYWVIVDTGSADNTIEIIHRTMEKFNIPGELHERPWVNFEVNRTESLRLAKDKCDYRWIIDADDTFFPEIIGVNPFIGLDKTLDSYHLFYKLNQLQFHRAQIVKSDQDWIFKGVLHEFLYLDKGGKEVTHGNVPNCYVVADISPLKRASTLEEKYANDAKILEEGLKNEPGNERYMFYLAQSYRDSDQLELSIATYQRRVEMGGWAEEVYYSMYMIAKISERMGKSNEEVGTLFTKAWEYRPSRLEAVFHAMRKLRDQKRYLIAFAYGDVAIKTNGTNDILFIEGDIWRWRLFDEYSLAAYFLGNPEIALEKTMGICNSPVFKTISQDEQKRLMKNIEYYKKGVVDKKKKVSEMQK
jgi:glycosyltransferase involved in cell wall biosynthesis